MPPTRAMIGPSSRAYVSQDIRITAYGEGAEGYWIIEPSTASDRPCPVVLFVHGLNLTHYSAYQSWITHLVRRGNVVIYPRYHRGGVVDPATFTASAAAAARRAMERCDGRQHPRLDTRRFAMIGHSLGGTIIANLAARPEHYGLPAPGVLMLLQPGDSRADQGLGAFFASLTEDHGTIPDDTLMLIVDVANDYFVSPKAGQRIFENASAVSSHNKRRLVLHSDTHGQPAILADHMLPMSWTDRQESSGRINAYDFALWRWFDALQLLAQGDEKSRDMVFGQAALDLGAWSDGRPVRRPVDASNRGAKR